MIPLQVHITAGPQAGTRFQLTQSPASFGRSPENTLVLDLTTVSRNHGELLFEDDAWWLVNLSQNGTKVGRKRVTKKPRELEDGASIVIGDDEVFRVYYANASEPAAAVIEDEAEETAEQPTDAAPGTGKRGRSKLWILLGVWFALCLGLFVLLATSVGNDDGEPSNAGRGLVFYESSNEVRQILMRDVEKTTPDSVVFTENIDKAREMFLREPQERYLYHAYRYYREAMQNLPASDQLGPEDRLRYDDVLDRLSVLVYERYREAYRRYKNQAFEDALAEINQLQDYYPANPNEDEIAAAIVMLRDRASVRASQR